MAETDYDLSKAVYYHLGRFPPATLDFERLAPPLAHASAALAKYDALLNTLHNSQILLAPLRRREAVISSRIEGTVATLDEILKYEADETANAGQAEDNTNDFQGYRQEVLEVFSYTRAMNHAQRLMNEGLPLSGRLLRQTHSRLLLFGRGADKKPGEFKTEQNYVVDAPKKSILFIPVDMNHFDKVLYEFEQYINEDSSVPLIKTAVAHAEFESIHPFKDGNGRLGRMLITLMLWNKSLISEPHFYISGCIERHKDNYINYLRRVSSDDAWTEWCEFFLNLIVEQAEENAKIASDIRRLYDEMKEVFRVHTSSQWAIHALDFVFSNPIFRNSRFTSSSGIPRQTAHRITNALASARLLVPIEHSSGRRSTLYAFEPLLNITRV